MPLLGQFILKIKDVDFNVIQNSFFLGIVLKKRNKLSTACPAFEHNQWITLPSLNANKSPHRLDWHRQLVPKRTADSQPTPDLWGLGYQHVESGYGHQASVRANRNQENHNWWPHNIDLYQHVVRCNYIVLQPEAVVNVRKVFHEEYYEEHDHIHRHSESI